MLDEERADGSPITVSGLVTSVQRKITKRGDAWAMVTLEDLDGAHRRAAVPQRLPAGQHLPRRGRDHHASRAGSRASKDQPEITGQEVTVPDLSEGPSGPVVISLPSTRCTAAGGRAAQGRARHPPGHDRGAAAAADPRARPPCMRLDDRLRVTPSPALFADLKQLLGPGCLTG